MERPNPQAALAAAFRIQADWGRKLGSPLYEMLLAHAAEDVEAGGPCWRVLEGRENDASGAALALQLMGAVHRLVLEGNAPELARYYPSVGGTLPFEHVWPAFRSAVSDHHVRLRELVLQPVQTNEVARSCALAGGFLLVARETGLALRLVEIGASAGLNLRWDHYWYQAGASAWGNPVSSVRFEQAFSEGQPPFDVAPQVIERRGCDRNPLDPNRPETELTLVSLVWPDQIERFSRLRAALQIARHVPAQLDAADAADWLEVQLGAPVAGTVAVVFHSLVMPYLDDGSRERIRGMLHDAGSNATASAPLAWLRMEPGADQAEVRLTLWPTGEERIIATSGFHGPPVRWLFHGAAGSSGIT